MKLEGTFVAMITPFTSDDEVDEKGMRKNINYLIENGVDGIVVAGTTGESATITHDEQERMIDILIDEVDGRVTTIAGAGSNSTAETLRLVKYAEKAGADAALVITPYYNKPQQQGLINHYKYITENSNIPIIIYNVPSRTGIDIGVDAIVELAKLDNIVALKEANPDLDKVSILESELEKEGLSDKFIILSGNDNLTLPLMALGAKGVISVVANVDPKRMSEFTNACLEGDYVEAKKRHYELYDLMKVLFIESNPVPAKESFKIMGMPAGPVRKPLAPMLEENRIKLEAILKDLSLI